MRAVRWTCSDMKIASRRRITERHAPGEEAFARRKLHHGTSAARTTLGDVDVDVDGFGIGQGFGIRMKMTLHSALCSVGLSANDGIGHAAMRADHRPADIRKIRFEHFCVRSLPCAIVLSIDERNATRSSL